MDNEYNFKQTILSGTYFARLDRKKRIRIPKQLMDVLIASNGSVRKLYLQADKDKIRAFLLSAVGRIKNELGQLSLLDNENRERMEEIGSTLHETDITTDDRIMLPNEMLVALDIRPDSEVTIKGAFEFITICKG